MRTSQLQMLPVIAGERCVSVYVCVQSRRLSSYVEYSLHGTALLWINLRMAADSVQWRGRPAFNISTSLPRSRRERIGRGTLSGRDYRPCQNTNRLVLVGTGHADSTRYLFIIYYLWNYQYVLNMFLLGVWVCLPQSAWKKKEDVFTQSFKHTFKTILTQVSDVCESCLNLRSEVSVL